AEEQACMLQRVVFEEKLWTERADAWLGIVKADHLLEPPGSFRQHIWVEQEEKPASGQRDSGPIRTRVADVLSEDCHAKRQAIELCQCGRHLEQVASKLR